MAIPADSLKLRIVSTDIQMDPVRTFEHLSYEVYHEGTGAIVASNKLAEQLTNASRLQETDTRLVNRALHEYYQAVWQFAGNEALGGYSPFDVSLMLEHWLFERSGGGWLLRHPLSGEYDGVAIPTEDLFPEILERATAIVARVLPPPAWAWASCPEPGKLSARCVPVPGATSYAVYDDRGNGTFTLLGTAPTAAGGTVDIAPGTYRVRMAGVKAGVTGILSTTATVEVLAAAVEAPAAARMKAAKAPAPVIEPEPLEPESAEPERLDEEAEPEPEKPRRSWRSWFQREKAEDAEGDS